MSLINEVLRDLEANRPNDHARQNLQREIRALPAIDSPRRGRRAMLWGLLVLALGAVTFSLATYWPMTAASVQSPVAVPVNNPLPIPVPEASPSQPMADNLLLPQGGASGQVSISDIPDSLVAAVAPLPAVMSPAAKPVALRTPEPAPAALAPVAATATPMTAVAASEPVQKIEKKPPQNVPRDPVELELHKAETAVAEGRPDEAAAILLQALERDRRSVPLRQALVRTLLAQKRFDEAMNRLSIGLNLMPEQTGWALTLARLHLDRNDLPAAVRTLENSRAYANSNADYAGFFGYLKSRQGEQREAGAYYLQAARLAPQEGRWWLGLGLALAADGKSVESREAMRRALASGSLSADLRQLAEQQVPAAPAGN
jgi:MSHA biogenesis protein MshN